MKKINTLIFLTLPLLLLSGIATGQAERNFVKTFNLAGKSAVVLNLGDNVQVNVWDSDVLRVQMTVKLAAATDATLKALAETGRYLLKSDMTESAVNIAAPFLQNAVKLNGNAVKETVTYIVFAPRTVVVQKNNDLVVAKLNP